jgi:signal transduction histidine kinase
VEILGIGKAESLGVNRGVVVNIEQTVASIKNAVSMAADKANVDIGEVIVGIAGQHIKSMQHRGMITRQSLDDEVGQKDIDTLIDSMHRLVMSPGEEIIHVIPQEIGRVLLNLINNAFHAVTEKEKEGGANYEPTVSVFTKRAADKIEVTVKDNGNGIPQKVLDKIFQPFFTTKPAGQGTGLGLSLSYDIITKGHGGELKVETKEGEGSVFIISLPVNNEK